MVLAVVCLRSGQMYPCEKEKDAAWPGRGGVRSTGIRARAIGIRARTTGIRIRATGHQSQGHRHQSPGRRHPEQSGTLRCGRNFPSFRAKQKEINQINETFRYTAFGNPWGSIFHNVLKRRLKIYSGSHNRLLRLPLIRSCQYCAEVPLPS